MLLLSLYYIPITSLAARSGYLFVARYICCVFLIYSLYSSYAVYSSSSFDGGSVGAASNFDPISDRYGPACQHAYPVPEDFGNRSQSFVWANKQSGGCIGCSYLMSVLCFVSGWREIPHRIILKAFRINPHYAIRARFYGMKKRKKLTRHAREESKRAQPDDGEQQTEKHTSRAHDAVPHDGGVLASLFREADHGGEPPRSGDARVGGLHQTLQELGHLRDIFGADH